MMGVDTDVLVRLVTRDDKAQAARDKVLFDQCGSAEETLFVSDIVLVELCWTLERSNRLPPKDIAAVMNGLLDNSAVHL